MLLRYSSFKWKQKIHQIYSFNNNNKSKLWQDSIYVGISLPFTLTEPMTPVRDVTDRGPTLRALPGFRLRYFGRVYSNKFIILNLFCRVDTIWCYYGG